jgi:MFS family permease
VASEAAAAAGPLPRSFWAVVSIWVVFSLGNSSDAFLLLRSKELGLGTTLVILAYAFYNVVYAGLAWPLGALSDRGRRERVIAAGLAVFALVYLGFALAPGHWAIWPLFAVYGVYVAATEGVAKAWVADQVPGRAIGTAFGIFSAATGGALLIASITAGLLWSHVSPRAPFVLGRGCGRRCAAAPAAQVCQLGSAAHSASSAAARLSSSASSRNGSAYGTCATAGRGGRPSAASSAYLIGRLCATTRIDGSGRSSSVRKAPA